MSKVCVVGLGYVGLPLACLCAKRGHSVIGLEKNPNTVEKTNKGICHIKDEVIQKSLDEAKKNLKATSNPQEAKDCTIFLICVPTPVDEEKNPDFEPLISSAHSISKLIKKKDLVVVESTVFPGTCEEYVLPILEKESGLKGGKDFYFSHCPERVNPGDAFWTTENIPRVVGGLTKECTKKTAEFYHSILLGPIFKVEDVRKALRPKFSYDGKEGYKIKTFPMGSITMMNSMKDAEAVKAMENTVRDVNIAFVNELAKISEALKLDVVDIIEGMSTKPFGKGPFYPGIGVGGHCIAVDPEWLKAASIKAGFYPKIIQIVRDTNNTMPNYAISLLEKMAGNLKGKKIAVLGVTYKGNIDDPRESPFYEVKKILSEEGADIRVFDPWYGKENTVKNIDEALKGAVAVLLVTDHNEFKETVTAKVLKDNGIKYVIDGRNCLDKQRIESAGIKYKGVGR
jgi:UDP-N-acetyl-D-glucosamine dehydrogenase